MTVVGAFSTCTLSDCHLAYTATSVGSLSLPGYHGNTLHTAGSDVAMKRPVALTFVLLFSLACNSGLESDEEAVDKDSEYQLTIRRGQTFELYMGTETEWNLDAGIVVLGPEETGEPLARLELHLVANSSTPNSAIVASAILSTSNLRSGPPGAIDARLYTGGASEGEVPERVGDLGEICDIRFVSSAQITTDGPCSFEMERIDQNGPPETIIVTTGFTATDAE
jgi:hypothetical protein